MRAAFEFRHDSWFDDEIFDLLKSRNIALCIADTDTIATPGKITADYGYLRLRREDYQTTDVERWADLSASRNRIGKTLSSISSTKKAASGRIAHQMLELLV